MSWVNLCQRQRNRRQNRQCLNTGERILTGLWNDFGAALEGDQWATLRVGLALSPLALDGAGAISSEAAAEGATLSPGIASTFANGEYTATTLSEDMTAYRYSGGVSGALADF